MKCFAKVKKCVQCNFASTEDRTLVFQESIYNNKSIGVTNSGNYKETQDVWSFQTDLFQKAPDQKSSFKFFFYHF